MMTPICDAIDLARIRIQAEVIRYRQATQSHQAKHLRKIRRLAVAARLSPLELLIAAGPVAHLVPPASPSTLSPGAIHHD